MEQYSEDEMEEIRLATELSLIELNKNRNNPIGSSSSYGDSEDEQLAIAIEQSLKISNRQSSSTRRSRRTTARTNPHQVVCDVCDQPIPERMLARSEFWNQVFCSHHLHDRTPICCACQRLQPRNEEYIHVDGRMICKDCYSTAIMDTRSSTPIVENVLEFFHRKLNMGITAFVPVFMVDREEIARVVGQGNCGNHPVLGFTKVHGETVVEVESSWLQGNQVRTKTRTHKLIHPSNITIEIMFGLPKTMIGGILAHEMMHAWLRLQGIERMEPAVEEGICQVIGYQWLDWFQAMDPEASSSSSSLSSSMSEAVQYSRNLIMTFKEKVETHMHEAYGDGFRDAQWAVAKYGLDHVIKYIVRYRDLPKN